MSQMTDFNSSARAGTDGEHRVQLALLKSLCDSMRDAGDGTTTSELLEQLISYTEAHFLSEELLMRMKSYDDYEDHVSDHVRIMESLRGLASAQASGEPMGAGGADKVLAFVGHHIATRDRRLAEYLHGEQ